MYGVTPYRTRELAERFPEIERRVPGACTFPRRLGRRRSISMVKPELAGVEFLVGRWEGGFETFPEAYGDRAGRATGRMETRWGPQRAWMVTEASMEMPGLGSYVVSITVAPDLAGGGLQAFVVNTAGMAALYRGRVEGPGKVVFLGCPSKHQRVGYTLRGDGSLLFSVEESEDAVSWSRHSGAVLRPIEDTGDP